MTQVPPSTSISQPAIELSNVWKSFPGVIANAGVKLRVESGTIHALLGENGAGKSTLMNVLAGVYRPDQGELKIHGHLHQFRNPSDALAAGIGMVHQEFRLIPSFSVAENVVLGSASSVLRTRQVQSEVAELAERFSLKVDPSQPLWQLSMGERQKVEILKILWRDAQGGERHFGQDGGGLATVCLHLPHAARLDGRDDRANKPFPFGNTG